MEPEFRSPWKRLEKEINFWKPSFSGSRLNFGGVGFFGGVEIVGDVTFGMVCNNLV